MILHIFFRFNAYKNLCLNVLIVSKNPDGSCNPKLGDEDVPGILFGITITIVSLAWTGWSATAPTTVGNSRYVIRN